MLNLKRLTLSSMIAALSAGRRAHVAQDFAWVLAARVAAALIGLMSIRLLRTILDVDTIGIYAMVLSTQGFVLALADAGLTATTSRLGAEFLQQDEELAHAYFCWTYRLRLRVALILGAAGLAGSPLLAWVMLGDAHMWYLLAPSMVALAPLAYIRSAHQAVLTAQKRFLALSGWSVLLAALAISFIAFFRYTGHLTLITALCAQVGASVLAHPVIVRLAGIRKIDRETVERRVDERWSDIKRVAPAQAAVGITAAIDDPLGYALLARLASAHEAGIYYGALIVAMPLRFFTETLASVLLPRAASMTGDVQRISSYVRSVIRLTPAGMFATIVVSAGLPLLVSIALGDKFQGSLVVAWIIVAAYAPGTILNALAAVLYPMRMERQRMWASLAAFFTFIVLRLVLIPEQGALGCGIALLGSKIVLWIWMILLVIIGMRRLRRARKSELSRTESEPGIVGVE